MRAHYFPNVEPENHPFVSPSYGFDSARGSERVREALSGLMSDAAGACRQGPGVSLGTQLGFAP